jgi:hypothetical protein
VAAARSRRNAQAQESTGQEAHQPDREREPIPGQLEPPGRLIYAIILAHRMGGLTEIGPPSVRRREQKQLAPSARSGKLDEAIAERRDDEGQAEECGDRTDACRR